jgi:hypothetical protein
MKRGTLESDRSDDDLRLRARPVPYFSRTGRRLGDALLPDFASCSMSV